VGEPQLTSSMSGGWSFNICQVRPFHSAKGLAAGLEKIFVVGQGLDSNTMRLQYFETLKQVGSSPSTKLVLPMELGGLLNGLRGLVSGEHANGAADGVAAKEAVPGGSAVTPSQVIPTLPE